MKRAAGWRIEIRRDWCKGCYLCIDVCPIEGIFTLADEIGPLGFKPVEVNPAGCTGCILCELLCPDLAITVKKEPPLSSPPTGLEGESEESDEADS